MSRAPVLPRVARRRPVAAGAATAALALLAVAGGLAGAGGGARAAAQGGGEVSAVTDDSIPAHNTTMIGSSAAGETWGVGEVPLSLLPPNDNSSFIGVTHHLFFLFLSEDLEVIAVWSRAARAGA